MTPERYKKIDSVFRSAMDRPPADLDRFLRQACGGDDALEQEVRALLEFEKEAGGFLERSPFDSIPSGTPIGPGLVLGPYRVDAPLGEGGMGVVFRATDTKFNRLVAVKFLSGDAADVESRRRFQREARLASSLNHPHILTVHDAGEFESRQYLVTEFVDGGTLRDWTKQGHSWEETVELLTGIADGLAAAHEGGITHRDIKPANILISKSGYAKLADFGLAKLTELKRPTTEDEETQSITQPLTRLGSIVGTPAYMSPEQACGKPLDTRSDIFSFGVVLYEALTGRRPFSGASEIELLAQIVNSAATPLPDTVPASVRAIVEKALAKAPADRYQTTREMVTDLKKAARGATGPVTSPGSHSSKTTVKTRPWKTVGLAAAGIATIAVAATFYVRSSPHLSDKDTIVLGDFTNSTGDPVFDETLRRALSVELGQSPFLSLVSDDRIQKTLVLMGKSDDAKLTPQLTREICERNGSAAYLNGAIASLGTQFVLEIKATNCLTGDVLDEELAQAPRKEEVLSAMSQMAVKFRTKVGESLATIEQHSKPLPEATTSSLEALKAFSAAYRALHTNGVTAVPLFKRAIEIDPDFALAHGYLGRAYGDIGESSRSAESTRRAYELRARATDPERLFITASFHLQVNGDLGSAQEAFESWAQAYPREMVPYGLLSGIIYPFFGKYEEAVKAADKARLADLTSPFPYITGATALQFMDRLDEADTMFRQALERKLEFPDMLVQRYDLAFVRGEKTKMDEILAQSQGKPGAEDWVLDRAAVARAFAGRLKDARDLSQRAATAAQRTGQTERSALYTAGIGVYSALFGISSRAGRQEVLSLSKARDAVYGAGLATALAGQSPQEFIDDLTKRFPEDSAVRLSYVPVLRALSLLKQDPAKAIDTLKPAFPVELGMVPSYGFYGTAYPIFVRGQAYLALHRAGEAIAEVQKILSHPGLLASDPIGAVARLQLGRAYAMSGDKAKAKAAYEDFLKLWKDADADIPILQQAQAEYGKL